MVLFSYYNFYNIKWNNFFNFINPDYYYPDFNKQFNDLLKEIFSFKKY
jgi:hypothetical protein